MIIVHGVIPILPERREQALELARDMSDATQLEQGCVSYDFYVGLQDPNTLVLFQEWETMGALMRHYQTEHMKLFMSALPEVVSGEITTRRFALQTMEAAANEPEENYASKREAPRIVH